MGEMSLGSIYPKMSNFDSIYPNILKNFKFTAHTQKCHLNFGSM
jgi:hypothetical protein